MYQAEAISPRCSHIQIKESRAMYKTSKFLTSILFFLSSIIVLSAQVPTQVAERSNNVTRITYPDGATFSTVGTATGAIRIELPFAPDNAMIRMRVDIYNFVEGGSFSAWISGYTGNTGSTDWSECSAQTLVSDSGLILPVRFGRTTLGDKALIWIGNSDQGWNNLKVNVAEIIVGFADDAINLWDDNWVISLDNSNFLGLVEKTIDNPLPAARITNQAAERSNDVTRLIYPFGATLSTGQNAVGAIKLQLPESPNNAMIRMRLELYNFFEGRSFTAWVSGFNGNPAGWLGCSAELSISDIGINLPIRFGRDNSTGKSAIWIGNSDQEWDYLKVSVAEIIIGNNNDAPSLWEDGWDISLDNSNFSNSTINKIIENPLPAARISNQVSESSGELTRLIYPFGASLSTGVNATGAIKIKLPVGPNNTMLRMRVDVYSFNEDQSFSAWISGFNGNPAGWLGCSAQILTSNDELILPVRFGHSSSANPDNSIIWIGNADQEWDHLKVTVSEVLLANDNFNSNTWENNWEISVDNSNFTNQVPDIIDKTFENPMPVGQSRWKTNTGSNITYITSDQVAIGLDDPGTFQLAVDGDIKARRLKVTAENWPDYVFTQDYDMMSLPDLERYINKHHHLPGFPSQHEAQQDGVYVNDIQTTLLEKVEELTLYIIEQDKRITELETKLSNVKKRTNAKK